MVVERQVWLEPPMVPGESRGDLEGFFLVPSIATEQQMKLDSFLEFLMMYQQGRTVISPQVEESGILEQFHGGAQLAQAPHKSLKSTLRKHDLTWTLWDGRLWIDVKN